MLKLLCLSIIVKVKISMILNFFSHNISRPEIWLQVNNIFTVIIYPPAGRAGIPYSVFYIPKIGVILITTKLIFIIFYFVNFK